MGSRFISQSVGSKKNADSISIENGSWTFLSLVEQISTSDVLRSIEQEQRLQEEQAMSQVPQGPIECSKLPQFVAERKKKRLLFKGEYLMIRKSQENHKMEYATHKENESKNFYAETTPYDYNRVILKPLPNIPHSHYINASYVDSFYQPKAYIIAQACKTKQSATDFWRMVWEQNLNCIVMLTKVFDFMKVMCMQYWPITRFVFGDLEIETTETRHYAHFTIRQLQLTDMHTRERRVVCHFHFTEWEVKSYPYISALLDFRRRVQRYREQTPSKGPLLLHCSDGGGRSGIYACIDANLKLAQEEGIVDIYGYCRTLINSRPNLVDNLDHYIFMYDVIMEALECNVAPFSVHEIQNRVTAYMSKRDHNHDNQFTAEYKLLSHLVPALRIGDCAGGHRLENRGKNRDVMVVPPDNARPYLSTLHGESKDYTYINAVYIDGFARKNEWIVTEWPKPSTVDSFWALIFDHQCHTVVNLSSHSSNSKTYPSFVHDKGKQVYGPFIIEVVSCSNYPYMTTHMIKIMKRRRTMAHAKNDVEQRLLHQTFMLTELMMAGGGALADVEVRLCCVINVKQWPIQNKVPLSTSGLIDLIKMARSWRKRAPDRPETKPTIVMSHNGYSRCGIYIAANIVIDQMDMDDEIDIFHAVKLVRLNRPQLVDHKEEYKYIYDLILHFYISSPEYRCRSFSDRKIPEELPEESNGNSTAVLPENHVPT